MPVGGFLGAAIAVAVAVAAMAAPAAATAAPVTVLARDGTTRTVAGPALHGPPVALMASSAARTEPSGPSVRAELRRLLLEGAIDPVEHDARRAAYDEARATVARLRGARRRELGAVVDLLDDLAARGALTGDRLGPVWRTLEANRRWWTAGPLLRPGQRVGFAGSELVWQHHPGLGVQLQMLASFSRLNGLWRGGQPYAARLATLTDEMVALTVARAGGVAWESYGTGRAPWVSAMVQATGVQALARAAARLGRGEDLLPVARAALGIFTTDPPEGVRVPSGEGEHFLLYSFDPGLRVLNGFLQALAGLHDLARLSGDPRAAELFARGERAARAEVPAHDTGAWSLYSRGREERESDLAYHQLVRDNLGELCERTRAEPYCGARTRFDGYVREPPRVAVPAQRLRGGRRGALALELSKVSRVTVRVTRAGRAVLARGPVRLAFGRPSVAWDVPSPPGRYDVGVRAVDLAGNSAAARGAVTVVAPRGRHAG